MPRIKQLSLHEAHKIAAGEVVERPANIVKELIENALDAEATQISIFIEEGGKHCIRVVDNGHGMDEQDAQACFGKHATSKITSVDELETVNTFGFRGEALSSIAAVARVVLTTKQATALTGIKVSVACSAITDVQLVPAVTGTDIRVYDLFHTVPARKKFLKKKETEWRHLLHLFQAFCLSFPGVHFKLYNEGLLVHNCPPCEESAGRFSQLWQHASMLPLSQESTDTFFSVAGVISTQHRYDKSILFFFVNNRWVKNTVLVNALLKGYQGMIPLGKYPIACVTITIDPKLVDINIHPRKEEVAFVYPHKIVSLIVAAVKNVLENRLPVPVGLSVPVVSDAHGAHDAHGASFLSSSDYRSDYREKTQEFRGSTGLVSLGLPPVGPLSVTQLNQRQMVFLDQDFTIIGQFNKTYILIEQENGIFIIDQHAAHERILYELFSSRFQECVVINLLSPVIIELSFNDYTVLVPYFSFFKQYGIAVEPFGSNQLLITAVPEHLKKINWQEIIKQVIGWIYEYESVMGDDFFKVINEKLLAQLACKAAIKGGALLTREHMYALLIDLHKTPNRFTCPHGRPTGFLLSLGEIEKRVKRRK